METRKGDLMAATNDPFRERMNAQLPQAEGEGKEARNKRPDDNSLEGDRCPSTQAPASMTNSSREAIMETEHNPGTSEKIKGRLKDLVGLPPGDKTPDGEGRPAKKSTVPEGGLTSPDAEGLNPHSGTGFQVE